MSIEKTRNIYNLPFPLETKVSEVVYDTISHTGPYKGAVDFVVPLGTSILSPLNGMVIETIDLNEKYGPTEDYSAYANYITLKHPQEEYSQIVHLEKDSIRVKIGDKVQLGQELALTGNSGWMTEPHLHFIVFYINKSKAGFKALKIQFNINMLI